MDVIQYHFFYIMRGHFAQHTATSLGSGHLLLATEPGLLPAHSWNGGMAGLTGYCAVSGSRVGSAVWGRQQEPEWHWEG